MPTVQIQQFHCAGPRFHDVDHYIKNACSCHSIPSLSARVSKLTLYDGNYAFPAKGFSSIVQPSRGCSYPIKPTKGFYSSSQSKGSSKIASSVNIFQSCVPIKNRAKSRSPTPTRRRFKSPNQTSYRSVSANRYTKCSSLVDNSHAKHTRSCDPIITKKLEHIFISQKNVNYENLSVQKKEPLPRVGANNARYLKNGKSAKISKPDVEIKPGNNNEVLKSKASSCSGLQLLHPGWRRVPWKSHFGWTDAHQELCKLLRQEIAQGSVESIYYNSEEAHASAALSWGTDHDTPFLAGPSVSSVAEVLEVIRKISAARSRLPWVFVGRSRWGRGTSEHSEYDADDEE